MFTYSDLFVIYFYFNYCSLYVIGYFAGSDYFVWLWNDYYLISNSFIDSLLSLVCLLFLFIWNIIAGMLLAVFLQEVNALYDCEMIIFLYSVHWFIVYLLLFVFFSVFIIWIIVARMFMAVFIRTNLSVCLWNNYYTIATSLINSILAKILMLFLFIWIIVARMLFTVLLEVITLYDCEMILIIYSVHWLVLYLLRSICCFFLFELL